MKMRYLTLCMGIGLQGLVFTATAQSAKSSQSYSAAGKSVTVFTTAKGSDYRLAQTGQLQFTSKDQPKETEVFIEVDPTKKFQQLVGIGGALTDASAETFYKLPKAKQQEFINAYYNKQTGIGYSLGRTTIQSCDFSSNSYTYVANNDKDLKTFDVSHDEQYRIPFIKEVIKTAGGKLTLFVSPWSPPAWMKTNNDVLHGGKLKPEYRQNWANFYVKFINTYEKKEGIPIWGLSVQNEPMATQTWESCLYTAQDELNFVKSYLGPTLKKSGMASKKLIIWDHNRDLMYQRASTVLEDPEAAKYVWGIGYHWYETWTGAGQNFENERRTHEAFPNFNLIFTEGCVEKYDRSKLMDWNLGERYGLSMVNDFNAGTTAWCDWNVLLDERGGPNHVGNFCFAPVHADVKTGEIIYTNAYYYIGHFSKFIKPGARRIISSASRDKLQTTAFQNTDGSLAVVVLNLGDDAIKYTLKIKGQGAETTSMPHSMTTLVIK
ncbi:glycoside hydrolase family 30 protein [Mucilaginibacter koreensis]